MLRACLPIHLPRYSSTTVNLSLFSSCHNFPLCSVPDFQLILLHQLLLHETRPIFPMVTALASLLSQQMKFLSLMYQNMQIVGLAAPMNCVSLQQYSTQSNALAISDYYSCQESIYSPSLLPSNK
ncbi:hypothetical protein AVEN_95364-1 [Araneus ventricosus]|uniref:Uncharacterized protein n=1 Tax=Araneus ventricosus TaxID=182803 RepID=A0A4Y2QNZ8_ARAVE|nr:hypothetical protein AVEN_95364-1 [Araneus ventricosus]